MFIASRCPVALGFFLYTMPKRVISLVDGFNVYHSIRDTPQYKWLDYKKLSSCFIKADENIIDVYYFTSVVIWAPAKAKRHEVYISALKKMGIKVVRGRFKNKDVKCRSCNRWFGVPVEKQTDINIATKLFELAHKNVCEKIVLISGDTDLVPAIEMVNKNFPSLSIHCVFPKKRAPSLMKKACKNNYSRIKETHLKTSLLPERISSTVFCPPEWKESS